MIQNPAEQIIVEQLVELQAQHPNFELQRDPDGKLWVRGTLGFVIEHNSRSVEDSYYIEILLADGYPDSPPLVFEPNGKIPPEFEHFMGAGNFCLEAPVEVRRRFAEHRNLLRFINEQVVPYLFAYSYKREYNELPFPDRPHGPAGLLQFYKEYFKVDAVPAMKLLKCLADDWAPPQMSCPCGSGHWIRNCHGPKLDELRPHLPPAHFEEELRSVIRLARLAEVPLPENQLMPKRMVKQEQRKNAKSRKRKRGGLKVR